VWLNGKHILHFSKVATSNRINLNFVNNTSPIVLTDPDTDHYKYVIRPVK
jgi:DNA polymerase III sliding clamp (beta) subunit (PCNA family)